MNRVVGRTPAVVLAAAAAVAAFAGVIWSAGAASAQTKTGTAIGQFLLIEPSARVVGMGNAGVSMDAGLQSVYYNPAAIGRVSGWSLAFTHSAWLADMSFDYAAAAAPLGDGSIYASLTSLRSGDIDVRTVEQPLGTGERYSVSMIAIGLGYGRQFSQRFSAGAQASYLQETIWHSSASTVVLNVGTLYRISEQGLHIGASLSNFGTHAEYSGRDLRILFDSDPDRFGDNGTLPAELFTDEFPLPILFRVGVGFPRRLNEDMRLRLALDAFHPSDNSESMSAGSEIVFRDVAAVRIGYQNLFLKDSEVGLTLGAGLQGRLEGYDYHADYAWADQGRLGSTHRVSLGVTF